MMSPSLPTDDDALEQFDDEPSDNDIDNVNVVQSHGIQFQRRQRQQQPQNQSQPQTEQQQEQQQNEEEFVEGEELQPRGLMSMNRIGDSLTLTRVLHGAGGERTNSMFVSSFLILFVMVLWFAFSGGDKSTSSSSPSSSSLLDEMEAPIIPQEEQVTDTTISYTDNIKQVEWHRQVQPRPNNVNLILIGNSTAHYSYLSLVYFLRWGRWFDPGITKSNLVDEGSFDNPFHDQVFMEFHYQTNIFLEPYELCDCYKSATDPSHARRYIFENRYYHDPIHNNTVTYIHAFGEESPTQGRILPHELYTSKWEWSNREQGLMNPSEFTNPTWKFGNWVELIQGYISKLQPKPEYAVFQAGRFANSFSKAQKNDKGQGFSQAEKILAELTLIDIHSFWRTTSYDKNHEMTPSTVTEIDDYMCRTMEDCLDMSWTKDIRSDLYWDQTHFNEPVYRVMNEELLEAIGKLPEDYVKYNRTLLF